MIRLSTIHYAIVSVQKKKREGTEIGMKITDHDTNLIILVQYLSKNRVVSIYKKSFPEIGFIPTIYTFTRA